MDDVCSASCKNEVVMCMYSMHTYISMNLSLS